jgi:hypothetical protein
MGNYVKILTTYGIAQVELFSNEKENQNLCMNYIKLMLMVTRNEKKKITSLTFDFWYEFKESLDTKEKINTFKNAFLELMKIIIKLNEIPEDYNDDGK